MRLWRELGWQPKTSRAFMMHDSEKESAPQTVAEEATKFLAADSELAREARLSSSFDAEWRGRYTRRLQRRRWSRWLLVWLLLPLGILLSAGSLFLLGKKIAALEKAEFFEGFEGFIFSLADSSPKLTVMPLSPAKRFLFVGDPARKTAAAQQRAIWEAHPKNRMYYANYIQTLIQEFSLNIPESSTSSAVTRSAKKSFTTEQQNEINTLLPELQRGEKLDPQNAYYNYLQAMAWLSLGLEEHTVGGSTSYKITAQAKVDNAIRQIIKGNAKPFLNSYTTEMTDTRLAALPPEKNLPDRLLRVSFCAGMVFPELGRFSHLSKIIPHLARQLIKEGRREEAEKILQTWKALGLKLGKGASTLVEILVAIHIINRGSISCASEYLRLGDKKAAAAAQTTAATLLQRYNAIRATPKSAAANQRTAQNSFCLYRLILSSFGGSRIPTIAEFAPGRWLEFIYLEYFAVLFLILLLSCFFLCGFSIASPWRIREGVLLLPDWQALGRIFGIGSFLPLVGYVLYTRYAPFAGRQFGLPYNWAQFGTETVLLMTLVCFLTATGTRHFVRRRCHALRIPLPTDSHAPIVNSFFYGVFVLMFAAILLQRVWHPVPELFGVTILPLALGIAIGARYSVVWLFCSHFKEYYKTLQRSLLSVVALSLLSLFFIVVPLLNRQERQTLARENLFRPTSGFSLTERELVHTLRESFISAEIQLRQTTSTKKAP